jgi:acyl carrier protein
MQHFDPRTAVRSFILERFLFSTDPADLSDAASLTGEGILDSMGALELVTFLEATFAIRIRDDEILPENLENVERIAAFVARKGEGSAFRAAGAA